MRNHAAAKASLEPAPVRYDFLGSLPFMLVHLSTLGVFFVSFSWWALGLCLFLVFARAFAITAGYHRYFAHKAYKTSRPAQFILAFIANTSAQMGPLWWAAHHRHHHRYSDKPEDIHSPVQDTFFWAHMGWILSSRYTKTRFELIQDFAKFPELRFLDKHHYVAPLVLTAICFGLGEILHRTAPHLGITSWQFLFWGFFLSTTLLFHLTFSINSLAHCLGKRRFQTPDQSRNNWLLGLLALGEGWHNNHHRYPQAARNGFFWWEIDITYYGLWIMKKIGLIWNLHPVPPHVYEEAQRRS